MNDKELFIIIIDGKILKLNYETIGLKRIEDAEILYRAFKRVSKCNVEISKSRC